LVQQTLLNEHFTSEYTYLNFFFNKTKGEEALRT